MALPGYWAYHSQCTYACKMGFVVQNDSDAKKAISDAGDRMRGNSLMETIRPFLQTGQRQGLNPVSLSKRSIVVSAG